MDRLPDGLALFGDCVKQDGALIRVTVPVPNAMFGSIDAFLMLVPGGPMESLEPLTKEGGRPLRRLLKQASQVGSARAIVSPPVGVSFGAAFEERG